MNKKTLLLLCLSFAALVATDAAAQKTGPAVLSGKELKNKNISEVRWSTVTMDSAWNKKFCEEIDCAGIVARYKPEVDKFASVIGVCPTGLTRGYPESELGDWTVDALFSYAQNYLDTTGRGDRKVDFALINSGGIRSEMPVGDVKRLDILTIFPFNNFLVIVEMPGKSVRTMMELFARTRVQVMSNVRLTVESKKVKECLIGGKPIEDDRTYNVATIDFLLSGGDGIFPLQKNTGVIESGVKVMDLIMKSIEDLTAAGNVIRKQKDGRVVIR